MMKRGNSDKPFIILTRDVKEYRKVASLLCKPTFFVIEFGCATGYTCYILGKIARKVYGFDKSRKSIEIAKKLYENEKIKFFLVDVFEVSKVLKIVDENPDMILIDISGSRDPTDVVNLLYRYFNVFKPTFVIIKNYKLYDIFSKVLSEDLFSFYLELTKRFNDYYSLLKMMNSTCADNNEERVGC